MEKKYPKIIYKSGKKNQFKKNLSIRISKSMLFPNDDNKRLQEYKSFNNNNNFQ